MKYLPLLVLLLPLLTACDGTTDTQTVATAQITQILDDIEESFNLLEGVEPIIAHYSDDYLHNGDGLQMAQLDWELRIGQYAIMDIVNLDIELNGYDATATFELHLDDTNDIDIFLEPNAHGDMSYFRKENGVWKIYGNQDPGGGNSLYISSEPSNARIYFDNVFMHKHTPDTLLSVPTGNHTLRLYKPDWNELESAIDVDQTMQLDYTLSLPDWPRPIFDIESPVNGETVNSATFPVAAIVQLSDEDGTLSDFDGVYVIVSVNGNETIVTTSGILNTQIELAVGENEVQLRATGAAGHTGVSDPYLVTRQ
ncbi:MAG: PEGA domain-containing protein [Candidatus Cloacimonetes bacterium]|nr:PEGA domain-containing protein [Candidatus Cloacimonadota bacterium]